MNIIFWVLEAIGISWFKELYASFTTYVTARAKYKRLSVHLHYITIVRQSIPKSRFRCMELLFAERAEKQVRDYLYSRGFSSERQLRTEVERTLQVYLEQLDNLSWFSFFNLVAHGV